LHSSDNLVDGAEEAMVHLGVVDKIGYAIDIDTNAENNDQVAQLPNPKV
jgi:hypothetical protein